MNGIRFIYIIYVIVIGGGLLYAVNILKDSIEKRNEEQTKVIEKIKEGKK